jgi:GNAT superfamily N-acetyltransferase
MSIIYSCDAARIDIAFVWGELRNTYWSPGVRRDIVERAVTNSLVVGAYDSSANRQVGFARAVTDRASFAWLCDVIVAQDSRGQGVATQMVRTLMQHPDLQTLRRWCLATKDAHKVYEPLGFVPVPADRWMEFRLDTSVWTEKDRTL